MLLNKENEAKNIKDISIKLIKPLNSILYVNIELNSFEKLSCLENMKYDEKCKKAHIKAKIPKSLGNFLQPLNLKSDKSSEKAVNIIAKIPV